MATRTADGATAGARGTDQTTGGEAAGTAAEGIQHDDHHEETGHQMNRSDGPHDEPDDSREQQAPQPADAAGEGEPAEPAAHPGKAPHDPQGADDAAGFGYGSAGDVSYAKEDGDGSAGSSADVGEGAGAVIAAGLGVVSLTGSWLGTVAGARESLIGQLQTPRGASPATQIREVYGDQWHAIALVGGIFALLALLIGVVVLAMPAFGPPGRHQAPWIKAVSWAGVVLGVIGLLLAVLKYTDALLALPSVQS